MTQFGNFQNFCRDSTLPVCNLFIKTPYHVTKSCPLVGFNAVGGGHVGNLGSILLCGIAVLVSLFLIFRSERKQAAVGRREMQLFLTGYIVISIAEIFTVGGILGNHPKLLIWFTAIHLGAITATCWILLLNALVGYQFLDDGTVVSIGLVIVSSLVFFVGTGYISLDTAFSWTNEFVPHDENLRNYALYVLYLLLPLVLIVIYFILEAVLVLKVLGEIRPMRMLLLFSYPFPNPSSPWRSCSYADQRDFCNKPIVLLGGAATLFTIGQIFDFVVSCHICNGTKGKIDGSLFETLFTLLAVISLWFFWSSITEDVWTDEPLNPSMNNGFADGTTRPYSDAQYA